MVKRSGLGRGLGALIPSEPAALTEDSERKLVEIPISTIRPNRMQPRSEFDEERLSALAASVREVGILQPVLVRPDEDGTYELIAGERRWRAARRAGLQSIPAIVQEVEDRSSLEHALIENIHRHDLNAMEEAAAYERLLEEFGYTHEQLAMKLAKSRSTITNTVRLLTLPPEVQRLVRDGAISQGHARAILGTPDRARQEELARLAVAEQLTVRQLEELVKESAGQVEEPVEPSKRLSSRQDAIGPDERDQLEALLSSALGAPVRLRLGPKKSQIVIDFWELSELEQVCSAILGRDA